MTQASDKQTPSKKRGFECPTCGCAHFRVLYTRRALGCSAAASAATADGG